MGILTDRLPDSVQVYGKRIPLETDFRRWILFTELMTDGAADAEVKVRTAVRIVCRGGDAIPLYDGEFALALMKELTRFAALGKVLPPSVDQAERAERENPSKQAEPVFDFEYDGERIYAAFRAVYGIDLCETELHWWKFMALLRHLPGDCEFMRVVQLRMCDVSRVEDENARRSLRRAKAQVRIRKNRQEELYG